MSNKLSDKERDATIKLLKVMTADLEWSHANFGSTVEGIAQHATKLAKHERVLRSYSKERNAGSRPIRK